MAIPDTLSILWDKLRDQFRLPPSSRLHRVHRRGGGRHRDLRQPGEDGEEGVVNTRRISAGVDECSSSQRSGLEERILIRPE